MATWSKLVTSTDAGGTADTFTSVGNIKLNSKAQRIVGIWMQAATITTTAAEANQGQYRFNFSDQGKGTLLINGPPSTGSASATQAQGMKSVPVLLPVNIKAGPNQNIPVEFSTHTPDPTAGCGVVAGVMYTDGALHAGFDSFFPQPSMFAYSDSEGLADGSTTAATEFADLDIPSWANQVVGVGYDSNHDAAGANGEELIGSIEFKSSIAGFEPQEYPLPAISAVLAGTVAGTGNWTSNPGNNYWPMSFLTGGGTQTVTPSISLVTAVTGAVAHSASILVMG